MDYNKNNDASANFEQPESQNILNLILYRYVPFWPLFVIIIVVCLSASWVYLRYQTPMYSSAAGILLKDEDKGSAAESKVLDALDVFGSKKIVENEIEILKSRTLMKKVVTDLGLYAQIYQKGNFRDVASYPSMPVMFIALNPDDIKAPLNIPISFSAADSSITIQNKKYATNVPIHTPFGVFQVNINKDSLSTFTLKKQLYLRLIPLKLLTKTILKNLEVSATSKQSTVIYLKLTDPSPLRGEAILNNLIRVYNKAGIDDKNIVAANTLAFVEERLKLVSGELSKVEDTIENYKSKEGIADISEQSKMFLNNVGVTDQKLSEIHIQESVLDQIEKYIVRKNDSPGTVPATLGITDPILLQLLEKLYDAELQLDRLRKTSGENSPVIQSVQSQIAQLKPSVLENVRNLKQTLQTTERSLQGQSAKYNSVIQSVPVKERNLLQISREQLIKSGIYTFLLQKREETALSYASAVADSRLVDAAESSGTPVSPVPYVIYLFGLFIGVAIGAIYILIKEQYNTRVLFRTEIESETRTPIISEIMFDPTGERLAIKDGKRTVIAEQFRAMRTSLDYLGIPNNKKTLLFTSSISGEGKSFTAINMAVSLTLTGKKVVLIEFDLRKPKITSMLSMPKNPGMTEYLAGLTTTEKILQPVPDVANLIVISAGAIPPNPTELILNGRLEGLMAELKEKFDYIIIDSPPVGLVTDAKLLNKHSDATFYMVRHDYTPKAYLKLINHLFVSKELNRVNIIFNGLKPRGAFGYGYGQNYGYGYGYSYGYGYAENVTKQKTGLGGFFSRLFK
ncbi:GumC family protein [Mucilaginibacter sp.]|uniref:GumC family protein n=1 Tax=Mucilaginibacter sp. TaxID=1882438 RepID=UPI003D1236B2